MIKGIGALLILASAAGIGVSFGNDLKGRCMELRMLKQMIYMLRGEIKYTKTPLPEAFASIAVRMREPFGSFLEELAEQMGNPGKGSFGELWQDRIKARLSGTHLGGLGEVLGYLDLEMQLSSIDLYLEQLELGIREAQEAARTKQKLYQSLGVAGGIFLVILLV